MEKKKDLNIPDSFPGGEKIVAAAIREVQKDPAKPGEVEAVWDIDWDQGPDHSHSD